MSAGAHGDTGSSMIKKRLLSDTPSLQRVLLGVPRVHALDRLLEQSGLTWSVASFAGVMLAAAGAAFLLLSYFGVPWLLRLPLVAGAALLPLLVVVARQDQAPAAHRAAIARCAGPDGARPARRPCLSHRPENGRR